MTRREATWNLFNRGYLAPRGNERGVHYVDLALLSLAVLIFVVVEIAIRLQNEPATLPALDSFAW